MWTPNTRNKIEPLAFCFFFPFFLLYYNHVEYIKCTVFSKKDKLQKNYNLQYTKKMAFLSHIGDGKKNLLKICNKSWLLSLLPIYGLFGSDFFDKLLFMKNETKILYTARRQCNHLSCNHFRCHGNQNVFTGTLI